MYGCSSIDPREPELEARISRYRDTPGMLAIRVLVVDWAAGTPRADFLAGDFEPIFALAEKHEVPLFCAAMGVARILAPVAEAHPDLTLVVDHFGLSSPPPMRNVEPDPWSTLPDVLALARFPNVAIKFSGTSALSREPYPHNDLWNHLTRVIDRFGPDRLIWASDFTRLRMGVGTTAQAPRQEWAGVYSEAVHFLRDTQELTESEKERIFATTFRRLLRVN